jgi:hypothetical protein
MGPSTAPRRRRVARSACPDQRDVDVVSVVGAARHVRFAGGEAVIGADGGRRPRGPRRRGRPGRADRPRSTPAFASVTALRCSAPRARVSCRRRDPPRATGWPHSAGSDIPRPRCAGQPSPPALLAAASRPAPACPAASGGRWVVGISNSKCARGGGRERHSRRAGSGASERNREYGQGGCRVRGENQSSDLAAGATASARSGRLARSFRYPLSLLYRYCGNLGDRQRTTHQRHSRLRILGRKADVQTLPTARLIVCCPVEAPQIVLRARRLR